MSISADKEERRNTIKKKVQEMNESFTFIDSAEHVCKKLKEDLSQDFQKHEVRKVMKEDLNMAYKKVQAVALHTNSVNNLVCRQRYAIEMFRLYREKKIILNIDESWLGMCDFRRMKWQKKDASDSVPQLQLAPRVSMILGLDTQGSVYLSLLQANNNA